MCELEVSSYEYRMKYASFWLKTKPTMFLKRKLIQQISKEGKFKETVVLRKAHACNISVRNSLRWQIYIINSASIILFCFCRPRRERERRVTNGEGEFVCHAIPFLALLTHLLVSYLLPLTVRHVTC